jgi:MscS family membrane protein
MDSLALWLEQNHSIILQVFLIVFASLLANYLIQRGLNRLSKKLEGTPTLWDEAFTEAATKPIAYCVALYGLSFSIQIIDAQESSAWLTKLYEFRDTLTLALVGWFVLRFIKSMEGILIEKDAHDPTTIMAITRLLRATVFITMALFIMQSMGYSVEGILAFGGIGGLAVGFAAQDLLANFFGGLMVYLDRPFSVGDWIRSPDRNIEGTVETIGWRLTCIRTFDKRPLYVPNSVFTKIAIENPSRMSNRRIKETIGLRYDDAKKIAPIIEDVRSMLESHPDIDTEKTLIVNFDTFAASSLDFFIYTFTKTKEWIEYHKVKQDVLLKIIDIIDRHGAEIAFPTSTVHLQTNNDEPISEYKNS